MRQPAMFPKAGLPRALEAPFAAFWAAYPERRPNPRALAEKEFARAIKAGAAADDLVAAAGAYAAEVKRLGTAMEFVVHAATFLRQQRWRDYLAPAEPIGAPTVGGVEPDHPLWPRLKGDLDAATFNAWIGRCRYQCEGSVITLFAPSVFIGRRVAEEFGALLNRRCGPVTVNVPGRSTP